MTLIADPIQLLAEAKREGIDTQVYQWGSYATYDQYRLPFRKTAPHLSTLGRTLDWGCGNGHFSYFLTRNGVQTVGYSFEDPPAPLKGSPRFEHVRGRAGEPVKLPFESASFDTVFSIGVLEHVHEFGGDQKASMQEVHRILKPGGTFFIYHLPNRYTWIEFVVRQLNRWLKNKKHQHSRLFTFGEFNRLLEGTSFELLASGRYNFLPRNELQKIPAIADTPAGARLIDWFDGLFAALLPWFCQNWYFVLRKRV